MILANRTIVRLIIAGFLLNWVVCLQIGLTEEETMNQGDFQIFVNGERVVFAAPPLFKSGQRLAPLEHFAEVIDLKVEYPEGENMAVLCGSGESKLCVPLQFGDDLIDIEGVIYVQIEKVAGPFGFEIYEESANRLEVIHRDSFAPDFSLPDLDGISRQVKDFRGKKTVLYVWGSW